MAFFPERIDEGAVFALPQGVSETFITTEDGERLQCFRVERPDAERILIYYHGNAGNIYHRVPVCR